MLPGFNLRPAGSTDAIDNSVITYQKVDERSSTVDGTSFTFTSVALGSADSTRIIVVGVINLGTVNFGNPSVTLGGVTMNVNQRTSSGTRLAAGWYSLPETSSSTLDIVVTGSNTMTSCAIVVYALYGPVQSTAYDGANDNSGDPLTVSISILASGVAFGIAAGDTTSNFNPVTWSGLTEDTDQPLESTAGYTAASLQVTPETLGLSVSVDHGGSTRLTSAYTSFCSSIDSTPAPTLTFIGTTVDATNAASATFAGHAIGTAASDRLVIVAAYHSINSSRTMTCTINGVSAAEVDTGENTSTNAGRVTLFSLLVTSGSTADIVITSSAIVNSHAIAVYTLTGLVSTTATFSTHSSGNSGNLNNVAAPTKKNAAIIAIAIKASTSTVTSTTLSADVNTTLEGSTGYHAFSAIATVNQTGNSNDALDYGQMSFGGSVQYAYAMAVWR